MSPGVPHMGYTYLNLLDSPVLLRVLSGFGCRGGALAAGLLRRGYRCFELRGAFSRFCRGHGALVGVGDGVGLGAHLQQGISEPKLYGDLVYSFRKL